MVSKTSQSWRAKLCLKSFVDMMWGRKANCDDFNQSGKERESAIFCLRVVPLKMCIFCFCDCFVRYLEKVVETCVISTNI